MPLSDNMSAEVSEIAAAGQPKQQTTTQTKKRKDSVRSITSALPSSPTSTTELSPADTTATTATKTTSHATKKRKADDTDATTGAASKKMKMETTKPAKPRAPRRTKKVDEVPPPPQAPEPVEVTQAVYDKIVDVRKFLAGEMAHEESMLERDTCNKNLVSVPEVDLGGIIMTVYFHYELGIAETDASFVDIEEAIVARFKKPYLPASDEVDWMTVDLGVPTTLEKMAMEKVAHHGLDGVNLLETEMELFARRNRARVDMYEWRDVPWMPEGEFSASAGSFREDLLLGEAVEDRIGDDGREKGRRGVCPAPAVELV